MPWRSDGDAQCDLCDNVYHFITSRTHTMDRMRSAGWNAWTGATLGGVTQWALQCRNCKGETRKRKVIKQTFEDSLIPETENWFHDAGGSVESGGNTHSL